MEAQMFLLQTPESFFSFFSPPRSETAFHAARARLEEDLKFTSKRVRRGTVVLLFI